jgi:poly-gamma-glutamate system protein
MRLALVAACIVLASGPASPGAHSVGRAARSRVAERFTAVQRVGPEGLAPSVAAANCQRQQRHDGGLQAERLMLGAMHAVRQARDARDARDASGAPWGSAPQRSGLDPDRAALIGVELSPLMTTMGSLESKRLATDPGWARALVWQLAAHGVTGGTTVLASFSGSFPGLNIAVMAACRALDARVVAVSSVTASTWGADEPGVTWPEMEAAIVRAGVLPAASVAIGLGGARDSARDLSEEGRALALGIQQSAASALGAVTLRSTTLAEAVAQRMAAYRAALGATRPVVYVNVGGNHASLGGARADLRHEEGWILPSRTTAAAASSVVAAWLADGVPVLNLLDVKSLARAWGLGEP